MKILFFIVIDIDLRLISRERATVFIFLLLNCLLMVKINVLAINCKIYKCLIIFEQRKADIELLKVDKE